MQPIDALKRKFRDGHHAQAIADCEALCRANPDSLELRKLCATMHSVVHDYPRALALLREVHAAAPADADVLFNIAMCERESGDFAAAEAGFRRYTVAHPRDAAGWASLAEAQLQLGALEGGIASADRAIALDASAVPAWITRGHCQKGLRRFDAALDSYRRANRIRPTAEAWLDAGLALLELDKPAEAVDSLTRAIGLEPGLARLRVVRGDALQRVGKLQAAIDDYEHALGLSPGDDDALKKASMCLLQAGQGARALELCRRIERARPDSVTAKLGAQWVLGQLVPPWHVPMMNEPERNRAYHDGLQALVTPATRVFEIGTGSGLLAMMAARAEAASVHTCEAVPLIAGTARTIVERNGLAGRVTVLPKPSQAVRIGQDMPARADLLVHEIFSSELLGEAVLPAIEDAKARLLAPGGRVLPAAASIVIALVGGDAIEPYLHAGHAFGFDLRDFNAIRPRKVPLHREDLDPVLMSDAVEAFRFDFQRDASFPAQRRRIDLPATASGRCHGIIQWIRIEVAEGVAFENHPSQRRPVTNWQHTVYAFEAPVDLAAGAVVSIDASHDRSRPWFECAGVAGA